MLDRRSRTTLLLGLATTLAASVLGAGVTSSTAATADPDDAGLSTPQEDSYYPAHGDPGIDTLHYDLQLQWKRRQRVLTGVADIRLRATADAPSFQLDLLDALAVSEVTVDGVPVDTARGTNTLQVLTPVVADQRYDVAVTYAGTPHPVHAPTTRSDFQTVGMNVSGRGELSTMQEPFGAFTWYPVNDQPSDKALYDLTITTPRGWSGVSNGELVSTERTVSTQTATFHSAHPMASYLTTLAVGQYAHRTATGPRGLPLEFWVPATEQRKYLSVLRHAASDLGWLEDELGRYPFESAGVVIVPGASAMETQTLVTFGAKLWTSSTYARRTVVHELAHQWWGDTVTPSDWRDLWLNEGMAMYVEARWSSELEHIPWRIWADFFRYENSTLRRHEGGPGAYKPRMFAENCVYYCTAAMYETIRKEIGNHAFWRLVRTWTHRAPDSNVDRAAFEGLVEQMTGRSWTRFFRTWLNSSTWPPK